MFRKANCYQVLFVVVALVSLAAGTALAATVTQSFTYQGKLMNAAGSPLTGTYSVTFRLYDASTGGSALSTDTHSVTATNGLFTTPIGVTSPAVIDGRAFWLGIKVGSDAEMTPRQEIRPVPYAMSLRPGATVAGSGSTPVLILTASDDGGMGLDVITSGDSSDGVQAVTSGTHSSGVGVKTTGNQSIAINVSTSGYRSFGVRAITNYTQTHGVWATTFGSNSNALWGNTVNTGSAAIRGLTAGDNSPGITLETYGTKSNGVVVETANATSHGVYATTRGAGSNGVEAVTTGANSHAFAAYTSSTASDGLYAETNAWGSWGVDARTSGDASYAVSGSATGGQNSYGVNAYSAQSNGLYADTGRSDRRFGVYTPDKISAYAYETNLGDVAEYWPVAGDVTPGTVLVLGAEGKLRQSTFAYDTGVAGIISTEPGISLGRKEEGNSGDQLVALAGRVPCRVDASYGPIRSGDLLTTSNTPGYAMKAQPVDIGGTQIYRPGTILGKAAGSLESGTGTIDVLVTLQ
jgi:hypothetical protein